MAVNELSSFTRQTGATYFNAEGLVVGVDRSLTTNTHGTGLKFFNLVTGSLQTDRNWIIGTPVVVTINSGSIPVIEGVQTQPVMKGTVVRYDKAGQNLVISCTTIEGAPGYNYSDWRIGYAGQRNEYDPVVGNKIGYLIESSATNIISSSENLSAAIYLSANSGTALAPARTSAYGISPAGISTADRLILDLQAGTSALDTAKIYVNTSGIFKGETVVLSYFVKVLSGPSVNELVTGDQFGSLTNCIVESVDIKPLKNSWYMVTKRCLVSAGSAVLNFGIKATNNVTNYLDCLLWGIQIVKGYDFQSYIPTYGVAVTKGEDLASLDSTGLYTLENSDVGTLVFEVSPSDYNNPNDSDIVSVSAGTDYLKVRKRGLEGFFQGGSMSANSDSIFIPFSNSNDIVGSHNTSDSNSVGAVLSSAKTVLLSNLSGRSKVDLLSSASDTSSKFVAVGKQGVVNLSVNNAASFKRISLSDSAAINDSIYFGTRYYCVYSTNTNGVEASIAYSSDGITWNRLDLLDFVSTDTSYYAVCANASLMVIAGSGGTAGVMTSANGTTWTAPIFDTPSTDTFYGSTFDNTVGGFILVGANYSYYSADGIYFYRKTNPTAAVMKGAASKTSSKLVAVGSGGAIYSTTNLSTVDFTSVTSGTSQDLNSIAYNSTLDLWVAVGANGTIISSPTALSSTWTVRTSGVSTALNQIRATSTGFVVVGNNGVFLKSTDGITWTSTSISSTSNLNSIVVNASIHLIFSANPEIFYSSNGSTFTLSSRTPVDIKDAVYGEGLFIAVGNSGRVLNIDATNYSITERTLGAGLSTANANCIYHDGSTFFIGNAGGISRSTDGTTWTSTYLNALVEINDIAFNGTNKYVAVGSGGISTSTDGITWTAPALIFADHDEPLRKIEFANARWVIGGDSGFIATSTDAITWTRRESKLAGTVKGILWNAIQNRWFVTGSNYEVVVSSDAYTWDTLNNVLEIHNKNAATVTYVTNVGLVANSQRENLVASSNYMLDDDWLKTEATVTANAAVDPFGTTKANLVSGSGASSGLTTAERVNLKQEYMQKYTASIYLKKGNFDWIRLKLIASEEQGVDSTAEEVSMWFNLATGLIGAFSITGSTFDASKVFRKIESIGSGWFRISVTYQMTRAFAKLSIHPASANSVSTQPNLGSGIGVGTTYYAFGLQNEKGLVATSYLATRGGDSVNGRETVSQILYSKNKIGISWNLTQMKVCVNGSTVKTTTAAVYDLTGKVNTLKLGRNIISGEEKNANYRFNAIKGYASYFTDAQLKAITQV